MGRSAIDHNLDSDDRFCTVCCIYFKSGPFVVSRCNVFDNALLRNYRRLIDGFLALFTQRPNKWNIEHAQRTCGYFVNFVSCVGIEFYMGKFVSIARDDDDIRDRLQGLQKGGLLDGITCPRICCAKIVPERRERNTGDDKLKKLK